MNVQIPDLSGKHIIVTGSNTGIGKVTATELAKAGAHVVMACRSPERGEAAVQEVRAAAGHNDVTYMQLDLGDFSSIRRFADAYKSSGQSIDVLVNNAGLAGGQGLSSSGFEVHFGVNHLGPFLLTLELLDNVMAGSDARIVNVASRAHYKSKDFDWSALEQPTATRTGFPEYCTSKLANVLFTAELGRRLDSTSTHTYCLHPGVVASSIWRRIPFPFRNVAMMFMITNEDGAKTSLHCAVSEQVSAENGLYYDLCKPVTTSKIARDEGVASELWSRSLAWTDATDFVPA